LFIERLYQLNTQVMLGFLLVNTHLSYYVSTDVTVMGATKYIVLFLLIVTVQSDKTHRVLEIHWSDSRQTIV
jgi:hypothetical protein